ncbi:hypothetical protein [Microvirga pakistanensis]|nr:hypothetical protein [Microvirga pakistanensis]
MVEASAQNLSQDRIANRTREDAAQHVAKGGLVAERAIGGVIPLVPKP